MDVQVQSRPKSLNEGDGTAQREPRCPVSWRSDVTERTTPQNNRSMGLTSRTYARRAQALGRVKTHWRAGTLEENSREGAPPESAMHLAQQDGPRHDSCRKTRRAARRDTKDSERRRSRGWRMPQRRYRSNSARMKAGCRRWDSLSVASAENVARCSRTMRWSSVFSGSRRW